ncbi:MAG: LamG-like jellyroll fold domain-containing protein, partial [Candidatus Thorarchaeota archaeon]
MPLKPSFGNMLGHGQLGLRSNLRTFKDLLDQSGSHRDIMAVVEPVLTVTGWSLSAGSVYVAPFEYTYKGIRRDIKSVSAVGDPDLTRGETTSLSAGQYYYDPDESFDQAVFKWDQEDGRWQIAAWKFDGATDVWVHSGDFLGLADGTELTVSFWFKGPNALPSGNQRILSNSTTRFNIYLSASDGRIYVIGKDSGDTTLLNLRTTASVCDGNWHHIIATANLAGTPDAQIYLDGTAQTVTTKDAGDIDYTSAGEWNIGAKSDDTLWFAGDLGQLWFLDDEVGDGASAAGVRNLFYDSTNSRPVDIQPNGAVTISSVTYTPLVYLYTTTAGENNGTAADFVSEGTGAAATTRPNHTDAGIKWDQFPQLYVNLTDNSNPSNTTVVTHLGYHFATRAQSHPTLGSDLYSEGGDFESWSAGVPAGWTEGSGDGTLSEETSDVWKGSSCVKLALAGDESDDWKLIRRNIANPVDGATYRLSGYYKTAITTGSGFAEIKVRDSSETNSIWTDGRLVRNNQTLSLTDTDSYWRFFCFDFYWDATLFPNDIRLELSINSSGGVGYVLFDDIQVRRVWRYEFYEPRMTDSAIPATTSGSNDIFFGGKRTSTGGVGFINHDKFFEVAGGQLEWINQRSTIFVGGRFLTDPLAAASAPDAYDEGQEILFNDLRQAYSGLIQRLKVDDTIASLDMQGVRTYFHIKLPRRVYADTDFPNL